MIFYGSERKIEVLDMEETGRLSDLNGEQTEGIEKIDLNDDLQELHSNCLIQEVTGTIINRHTHVKNQVLEKLGFKIKISETKSETESTSDIIIEPDCETESEIELNEKENEESQALVQESSKRGDDPQVHVIKERDLSPAANPPNAFIPQSAPCPMRPPQQARD